MLAVCLAAVAPSFCALSFPLPSQNAEVLPDIVTEQPCLHCQGARAGFAPPLLPPPAASVVFQNPAIQKPGVELVYLSSATQDRGVCNRGLSGFTAEFQLQHGQAPLCVDGRHPSFVQLQIWSEASLQPDPTTLPGA